MYIDFLGKIGYNNYTDNQERVNGDIGNIFYAVLYNGEDTIKEFSYFYMPEDRRYDRYLDITDFPDTAEEFIHLMDTNRMSIIHPKNLKKILREAYRGTRVANPEEGRPPVIFPANYEDLQKRNHLRGKDPSTRKKYLLHDISYPEDPNNEIRRDFLNELYLAVGGIIRKAWNRLNTTYNTYTEAIQTSHASEIASKTEEEKTLYNLEGKKLRDLALRNKESISRLYHLFSLKRRQYEQLNIDSLRNQIEEDLSLSADGYNNPHSEGRWFLKNLLPSGNIKDEILKEFPLMDENKVLSHMIKTFGITGYNQPS